MTKIATRLMGADGKALRSCEFDFDLGTDLDSAVAKFGKECVYNLFVDAAVVKVQASVRANMKKTGDDRMTDAQIKRAGETYDLTSTRKAADPVEAARKALEKLTPEQRKLLGL